MSYEWIRLLHVLAGIGFIAVHGASMLVLHSIRNERSRDRISTILDFASRTTSLTYVTLFAVVGTGAWLGFIRSSLFRRGWFWWSLGILVSTSVWMWFVARPFGSRLRAACELRPSGVPRVSDEELAEMLRSRHADLIAGIGVGGIVLILVLMMLQPRLPEESGASTDVTSPPPTSAAASPSSVLPAGSDATPSTVLSTETTNPGNTGVLALGREIFEVRAGGVGCASCHGSDGLGTDDGPEILGSSKGSISDALEEEAEMEDIRLTPDELEAVYQYLRTLLPGGAD